VVIPGINQELLLLLNKVYFDTGCDFRQYKETTLERRIERRLHATNARTYADYLAVLDSDSSEYDRLLSTLTIKVTGFFRELDAFSFIEKDVLPEVLSLAERSGRRVIRIWSAGCASGEEPYSLAILVCEILGEKVGDFDIAIYGTDIDRQCLLTAERGRYGVEAVSGLTEVLMDKYFSENGEYSVRPELSRLVRFYQHNLASDPPLLDLDLIVCRNVLIYFTRDLQERVFMNFHRGLRSDGFLFLGKAETLVGRVASLFRPISKEWRIYRKLPEAGG